MNKKQNKKYLYIIVIEHSFQNKVFVFHQRRMNKGLLQQIFPVMLSPPSINDDFYVLSINDQPSIQALNETP